MSNDTLVEITAITRRDEGTDACSCRVIAPDTAMLREVVTRAGLLQVGAWYQVSQNPSGITEFPTITDERGRRLPDPGPREPAPVKQLRHRALSAVDLTGRSVIDIGGYTGMAAAYALAQGARRAVVVEVSEWQSYINWEPIRMPPEVDLHGCDWLQWEEPADVLIAGNIIYHVREPWTFLRRSRWLCREAMVLWTPVVDIDEPVWRVHLAEEAVNGPFLRGVDQPYEHVFWRPSLKGLLALLQRTGWTDVTLIGQEPECTAVVCR